QAIRVGKGDAADVREIDVARGGDGQAAEGDVEAADVHVADVADKYAAGLGGGFEIDGQRQERRGQGADARVGPERQGRGHDRAAADRPAGRGQRRAGEEAARVERAHGEVVRRRQHEGGAGSVEPQVIDADVADQSG